MEVEKNVTYTGDVIFVLLTSFFLLSIGSFVLYKNPKERVHQSFFYLALAVLLWTIARYFEDSVSNVYWRNLYLQADYALGGFFAFSILLFSLDIVRIKVVNKGSWRVIFFLIPFIIAYATFFTQLILNGYTIDDNNIIIPQYGLLGNLYDIVVSLVPLSSIGFIFWGLRKVKKEERAQIIYTLIGIFLCLIIVLFTNVLFSGLIEKSVNFKIYSLLGTFSPILIVLFPGYAILKFRMFNIKVLAAETLSFFILLVTFTQIFLSEDPYQISIRSLIFLAMFLLVGLLARSVNREFERKEELQHISDNLAIANQELRRLDNAKSEFISIASHQLRTPLTAIKGFVSLLLEGAYGKIPREVQDTLNKVYLANSRLMQLVENLLNISRIESGRIQYSFAPAQIEEIVTELIEMFSLAAREKGLSLSSSLPEKKLPEMNIDAAKMREVFSNLIDNAMKYTERGGIIVRVEEKEESVEITVEDTGMGIDPDDLPHLFKKFERGKQAVHVNVSSTGLGLYVGKNFVEAHKGTITAYSDGVDKGARFVVSLPLQPKNVV